MSLIVEMWPAIENLEESNNNMSRNDGQAFVVIGGEEHR